MPPVPAPRKANVSNNTHEPPTGNKDSKGVSPNLVQLIMESFVVGNESELTFVRGILFQGPIRRRSENKMDRLSSNPVQFARITATSNLCYRGLN